MISCTWRKSILDEKSSFVDQLKGQEINLGLFCVNSVEGCNNIYHKIAGMRQQGQLVRVRKTVSQKLLAVQLLLSVRKQRVLTKSNTLDIVLEHFLSQCNGQSEKSEI